MTRPQLTADLTSEEFKEYYFLKEELKDFLRSEGLKVSGSKNELEERIIHYLDTGKQLDNLNAPAVKAETSGELSLDSKIGENFKCSEEKREFFENEIGKGFKFKVAFQKWLKSNPEKTYSDAITAYNEIMKSRKRTKIDKQFQYNQYIRDFFDENDGLTLNDAIKCWKYKKSLKGHNRYEKSDLKILEN